jgi:hypothetical protein
MNSQSSAMPTPSEGFFTIENEIFSPDGDGFEDELIVHFNTQASGQVVKAFIADLAGQMVRSLSGHTLIGSSTILAWDGADQIGTIRPPGPYLLMIEIIGADGRSDFFREAVVLAGGL